MDEVSQHPSRIAANAPADWWWIGQPNPQCFSWCTGAHDPREFAQTGQLGCASRRRVVPDAGRVVGDVAVFASGVKAAIEDRKGWIETACDVTFVGEAVEAAHVPALVEALQWAGALCAQTPRGTERLSRLAVVR